MRILPAICLGALLPPLIGAGGPDYVNSHRCVLTWEGAPAAQTANAIVWIARDGGPWQPAEQVESDGGALRFTVPDDGAYRVRLGPADATAPPAEEHAYGETLLIVDTRPPIIQLHEARRVWLTPDLQQLELQVSLYEPHLAPAATRLFFRRQGSDIWQDGGAISIRDGRAAWTVPAVVAGDALGVTLVATDLAGNRALVRGETPAPPPMIAAGGEQRPAPDAPVPPASAPAGIDGAEPLERFGQASGLAGLDPGVRRLHEQARKYAEQGRWPLAASALEEAVKLAPTEATLLLDLGSARFRMREFEAASARFSAAMELPAGRAGALEGLALLAASQQRYGEARERLSALLEIRPDFGDGWLRLGDVEHRLGEATSARSAWQRSLELAGDDAELAERARKRLGLFALQPDVLPAGDGP